MLEKAVVQNIKCNPEYPLCLYDFTVKHVMTEYLVFSVPNLLDAKKEDYYYGSDYLSSGKQANQTDLKEKD